MIRFCSLSSILGSPPEVKHVCCVFKLTAVPLEMFCSDGDVVVLSGKSTQAAQLVIPLHSGGWLGLHAKGRKKDAICDYLEEMQTRTNPAVTDAVKCGAGGLCCTHPSYESGTEVHSYILFLLTSFLPYSFNLLNKYFIKRAELEREVWQKT